MTSSLHVSLPDEMRQFVDCRTNGEGQFSTPSEYVRALIREDMNKEEERHYVYGELLKSAADIEAGRLISAEDVRSRMDNLFVELAADPTIDE